MAGSSAKRKGSRVELEIVKLHEALGVPARKQPLSGALGGDWAGDIDIGPLDIGRDYLMGYRAECKARRDAGCWKTIKRWLGANGALFLKQDRCDPLVVLSWSTYSVLVRRVAEISHAPGSPMVARSSGVAFPGRTPGDTANGSD